MQIRIAPSLGSFEEHPNDIWGTTEYTSKDEPTVFFGLYGLPDFFELWRHRGKKYIFWAGSDIRHFMNGYWLDTDGKIRIEPGALAKWINQNCESWVENTLEQEVLMDLGIESHICPSFLGKVNAFPVSYKHSYTPSVYTSVSGNDFDLYGWHLIPVLAKKNPYINFHLYGNTVDVPFEVLPNMHVHGRVPKEQMNEEIAQMQGALRLTYFDGFSEILAKSVLMGQYPVTSIPYPHMLSLEEIGLLKMKTEPNTKGRDYYLEQINQFPWNTK